jgi:prepilin-type N-terminal cleavage/methylation domain-containing protein
MPVEHNHNPGSTTRLLRGEDGFTLIELLVVVLLLSIVVGALMGPLTLSQRIENRASNYAAAQRQARTGLDSMVSQIRQAWVILSTDPNAVEMNVNLNGVATHVLYECDIPQPGTTLYRECVRVQSAAGASLPSLASGTIVLRNLTNGTSSDPVFSFTPDPISPYYMAATIKVPASDGMAGGQNHSIVFSNGTLMRNQNVGN